MFRVRPFEYLASTDPAERLERLFCASVEAFADLPRPTRREISQLEDLAMPLLDSLSETCLRFVAEKLADATEAPPALIRHLADMPVRISAPLLKRSPILSSLDLLALVGKHGVKHARAIAMRSDIDPDVSELIRSIGSLDANEAESNIDKPLYAANSLKEASLSGDKLRIASVLAEAINLPVSHMSDIVGSDDIAPLIAALRAIGTRDNEAFLLLHCLNPQRFSQVNSARQFFEAYGKVPLESAMAVVKSWQSHFHQTTHTKLRAS